MKHISPCQPFARASLATCAILLGAAVAFGQSGSTSSSSGSASPTRDSSAGQSGTRSSSGSDATSSSAGSNYGSTDKSASGSSSVNAGTNGTTGGSAYGSSSWSGQSNGATGSTSSTSATDSNRAGAPTGRETTASTSSTSSGKLGFMDRRFVTKAADGGMAEVSLAQLAAERASNPEVKRFAQQLVDDHTQVNSELMSLASQKNVKLDKDDGKDRTYKRLSNRSGADFDQEFVEHMIDEHEKDIKMFEKASTDAKDSDLRSFAAKHVDHLRHHLQMAQGLRSSIVPTGRDNHSGYESDPSTVRGGATSTTDKASGSDRSGNYQAPMPSATTSSSSTDTSASASGGPSSSNNSNTNRNGGR